MMSGRDLEERLGMESKEERQREGYRVPEQCLAAAAEEAVESK